MCSSKPPKPDPAIGQAAQQNAQISKEMAAVARDELAWNKARAAEQDPLIAKIAQQQIDTADVNQQRSQEQWDIYKNLFHPVEERMVEEANTWDSPERKAQMAAEAGADVTRSYQGSRSANQREMERMGVNPNSGRFAAINNENLASQAKDEAGAMNAARRATEQQGVALRTGVAQFGRNMPNTGIAADSLSLNAGNSAANTMQSGAQTNAIGSNTAANWFGGANSASSSAGNIGLGLYGQQVNAWAQNEQNKAASMAGLGQLAGTGAAMAFFRRGGIVGKTRPMHLRKFAGKRLHPRRFAEGGLVVGGEGYMSPEEVAAGGKVPVEQQDGTISTEKTMTIESDGKHLVIPTIIDGQSYDQQAAANLWATGKNPPIASFDTAEEAEAFAQQRSMSLDAAFGGSGRLMKGPSAPAYGGLKRYAGGGMVQGPGTGTSDSVPAVIDGAQPAALSNGEGVLNVGAVGLVGEDFVNRINQAGLSLQDKARPATAGGLS